MNKQVKKNLTKKGTFLHLYYNNIICFNKIIIHILKSLTGFFFTILQNIINHSIT